MFNIDGYLNGGVTTDDNNTFYRKPDVNESATPVREFDFVEDAAAPMYYVSTDPGGRLGWQDNFMNYGTRR